ncbi:MAG: 2-oxo acid dehydrogenase subunit E2 [Bacteroidales bacterium]|jgi:pyruvate/2-oxoglutarate dehydrogenase complex dihydrolipoamide acyltransferase (E2) component|nr:2-oxo acid dehydrogenase subunit E2 [Bacteroidales bacterium]MCI1785536.1 2-oxo acid dehydrogenase subunit E2 [Bacteroidales bacterium]
MKNYKTQKFPDSRIASIDICEVGKQKKHHITALIEADVTDSRKKIKEYNRTHKDKISFNSWLISTIAGCIKKYEAAAAYLYGKRRLMIFDDINVSIIVEKDLGGTRVPIPLVIEKADKIGMAAINSQINEAKDKEFKETDITLHEKAGRIERLYYSMPGCVRRAFWKFLLKHPKTAYGKMGNVTFTSIGMMGKVNGWFIPIAVHPICFGISSIIKKPYVAHDAIEIREILNMSILIDHDVIDGAPMARFINELNNSIETGSGIEM